MRFGIRIALLAITTAICGPSFPSRSATKSRVQATASTRRQLGRQGQRRRRSENQIRDCRSGHRRDGNHLANWHGHGRHADALQHRRRFDRARPLLPDEQSAAHESHAGHGRSEGIDVRISGRRKLAVGGDRPPAQARHSVRGRGPHHRNLDVALKRKRYAHGFSFRERRRIDDDNSSLMIPRNRVVPRLRPDFLPVFRQVPLKMIIEILRVAANIQHHAPHQRAIRQITVVDASA